MNLFKRNNEKKQHEVKPAGGEVYLNPDLNFWENRATHRHAELPEASLEAQAMPNAPMLTVDEVAAFESSGVSVETQAPPDASHTLLRRGRWVRPWGLRNFAYSFLAFFGLQTLLVIIVTFIVVAQAAAADPTSLLTSSGDVSNKILQLAKTPAGLAVGGISMYAVWLGYMWWATRFRGARSWAKDFGLWFKKRDILIGIGTAAAVFGLETGVSVLIQALVPNADYSGMDNGAAFTSQSALAFFFVSITIAGIIGPICEELYFRGFFLTGIQRWLTRYAPRLNVRWVSTISVIASSILFGLLHFQGVDTFGQILVVFYTGGIGVVLAIYRVAFKRLGPGIFTHMAFNTGSLLLAYFAISN